MAGSDSYMVFVGSSTSFIHLMGKNQHYKCGMITWYSQSLHISLNVRYVSLFFFETYPFTLLSLHFGFSHKLNLTVFWFIPITAPVIRIEPNVSQTLLIYDGVAEKLSQVGWIYFAQSFRGFNLDIAK
jgi:hypothetical protein